MATKQKLSAFRCGLCGRKLPVEQYLYSRFTGSRYCLPGQCKADRKEKA